MTSSFSTRIGSMLKISSADESSSTSSWPCTIVPDDDGHVTIPDGQVAIGPHSFRNCAALRSIHIPSSVATIETYAFAGCKNLTSIEIPSSVHTIAAYAFAYSGLNAADIPDGTITIATFAFAYTPKLISVTIPTSVVTVGAYAFASSSVASVCIDSVTTVGTCTCCCLNIQSLPQLAN